MSRVCFPKIRAAILHLLLISLLAFSLMPRPQPARAFLDPISLGALAGLSEVVGGNVRSATATLGAEIRQTVDLVLGEIDSIIGAARAAYTDALNTTINNFDAFTSSKLLEVQQLLFTLNELVSQNIDLVRDRLDRSADQRTPRATRRSRRYSGTPAKPHRGRWRDSRIMSLTAPCSPLCKSLP